MRAQILIIPLVLCLVLQIDFSFGQKVKELKWKQDVKQFFPSIYQVELNTKIPKGCWTYSIDCVTDKLTCTRIDMLKTKNLRVGTITESGQLKVFKKEKIYSNNVSYLINTSKIVLDSMAYLSLIIDYQVCDSVECEKFQKELIFRF